MSAIDDILLGSKNESQEFKDDGQIKEFLVELGIASQFKQESSKETIQAVSSFHHNSHFIFVLHFQGYSDLSQNGYRLWCISKSDASIEIFEAICRDILSQFSNKVIDMGVFFSGPGNQSN